MQPRGNRQSTNRPKDTGNWVSGEGTEAAVEGPQPSRERPTQRNAGPQNLAAPQRGRPAGSPSLSLTAQRVSLMPPAALTEECLHSGISAPRGGRRWAGSLGGAAAAGLWQDPVRGGPAQHTHEVALTGKARQEGGRARPIFLFSPRPQNLHFPALVFSPE